MTHWLASLGRTELLGKDETLALLPNARARGLLGGVKYWDGQFDDARLALALARSAQAQGALVLNYFAATHSFTTGRSWWGSNARTGRLGARTRSRPIVWSTQPGFGLTKCGKRTPLCGPVLWGTWWYQAKGCIWLWISQFLASDHGLMIPKTADGRVLFAVPWLGRTILGTTDTPRTDLPREPRPFQSEVRFILGESAKSLAKPPKAQDVKSAWVGLRPLVKPGNTDIGGTKSISREHLVEVAQSGLVTVTGGKWTTYRAMAEDVLQHCVEAKLLKPSAGGQTKHSSLQGAVAKSPQAPKVSRTRLACTAIDQMPEVCRHCRVQRVCSPKDCQEWCVTRFEANLRVL